MAALAGLRTYAQRVVKELRAEPNLSKLLACDGVRQLCEAFAGLHPAVVELGLVVHVEGGGGTELGFIEHSFSFKIELRIRRAGRRKATLSSSRPGKEKNEVTRLR